MCKTHKNTNNASPFSEVKTHKILHLLWGREREGERERGQTAVIAGEANGSINHWPMRGQITDEKTAVIYQ